MSIGFLLERERDAVMRKAFMYASYVVKEEEKVGQNIYDKCQGINPFLK